MMLLALAAVVAAPDRTACFRDVWRPREEQAMCQFTVLSSMPELVQFRNVRVVGDYVCGEVNEPGFKKMSGFHSFVYKDRHNWAERTTYGYNASFPGTDLADRIRDALRRGNVVEAQAYRVRKAEFDAAASALLSACSQELDAD